jgi:hypothetical protein
VKFFATIAGVAAVIAATALGVITLTDDGGESGGGTVAVVAQPANAPQDAQSQVTVTRPVGESAQSRHRHAARGTTKRDHSASAGRTGSGDAPGDVSPSDGQATNEAAPDVAPSSGTSKPETGSGPDQQGAHHGGGSTAHATSSSPDQGGNSQSSSAASSATSPAPSGPSPD